MKIPSRIIRIVVAAMAVSFIMPFARAGTDIWTGGGGANNLFWLNTANWSPVGVPQAGDDLVFINTTGLVNSNNIPSGNFNSINFATPSGGFVLNGFGVTLKNITDQQVVTLESINLPTTIGSGNLNITVTNSGQLNLNSVISGAGALTNSGNGVVMLGGNNTFAGPLVVNAGTMQVTQETNLPAAPVTPTAGSIILNNGALQTLASFTLNTNHGITVGPASGSGQGTINVNDQKQPPNQYNTLIYGGVIANNGSGVGGLTKLGFGNLILSGANTYTGTTSNEIGTLTLDFSATTGAPLNNIISSSSPLTLGGTTSGSGTTNFAALVVSNKTSTINSQTFNGTHITVGGSFIRTAPAGGTLNLALGNLDHDIGGTTILLPPSTFGGTGNITTTPGINQNGILGGWATIGSGQVVVGWQRATNWACVDGSGNIVNFNNYITYSDSTGMLLMTNLMNASSNIYITGVAVNFTNNVNGAGTTNDVNSMVFNQLPATANFIVGSNNTIRLGVHGGLMKKDTANVSFSFGDTSTPGDQTNLTSYLTAGGPNYNTAGEIVFVNTSTSTGAWAIDSVLEDNGSGPVSVVMSGSGYYKFRGHNTYSGGTYVLGGRLQQAGTETGVDAPDCLGTGPVYVFPGAYLFGNFSKPVINIAGFGSAQEPDGAVRVGTGAIVTNAFVLFGDSSIGGGEITNHPAILMGPISGNYRMFLGAQGNVSTAQNGLQLSNQCLWTGDTYIVAATGTTKDSTRISLGENDALPHGFGKGNLIFGVPGIFAGNRLGFDLNGFNQTINALISGFAGVTNVIFNTVSGTSTLTIGDNDASGTWGGFIEDTDPFSFGVWAPGSGTMAITKIGSGIEVFTNKNTYTGATTISNGVLQLTGLGAIASSTSVNIKGGTFDVSGAAYTIPAVQTINISGGTFAIGTTASSSTTPVNFTNGTLAIGSKLIVGQSANLTVPTLNIGGSANVIQALGLPSISSYPQIFPIIKYQALNGIPAVSGIAPTFSASLPAVGFPPFGGFVSNDTTTATATIYLVLTNGPVTPLLTWVGFNGGALNGLWDISDNNWTNKPAHQQATYSDGSLVVFDDSGRTNMVTLAQDVLPAGVTFNNTNVNYTLTGGFGIHSNSLTMQGTGKVILDNTGVDTYSGGLTISAGTVQVGINDNGGSLGSPLNPVANNGTLIFDRANSDLVITNSISGSSSGLISNSVATTLTLSGANTIGGSIGIITGSILQAGADSSLGATNVIPSGAALDINGKNLAQEVVVTSGSGVNPLVGAIYNGSATAAQPGLARLTLLGDTTIGAPVSGLLTANRWDLRSATVTDANGASLSTGGNAYNLTKIGNNQVSIAGVTVDPALANIDVQQGVLSIESATTGLGNPSGTLTVENGADLSIYQATNQFNKNIVLDGNGINNNLGTVNSTSGNNTIAGLTTLNGNVEVTYRSLAGVEAASGSLTLNNLTGNGLLLKEDTNTTLIVSGTDNHTGGTAVNGGIFLLNTINPNTVSGLTNVALSTIGGNGTNMGTVWLQGTLFPGVGGKPSTFGVGSTGGGGLLELDFNGSPQLEFSLGAVTNAGGGVNDLININGDLDGQFEPVIINQTAPLQNGNYTLIQYTGSELSPLSTFLTETVNPTRYTYSLTQGSGVVALQVSGGGTQLEWNNGTGDGLWNAGASSNWLNQTTSAQDIFDQLDSVVLDDSVGGPTNTISINTNSAALATNNAVIPGLLLVNNSSVNYVINGPGKISGGASIVKTGTGTLTINNANDFTGTTTISNGTLTINNTNALGGVNNAIIVTSGGTLDIGGASFGANLIPMLGSKPVFIAGMGVNSKGAIINGGANQQQDPFQNLTLTADAAIGGDGARWDVGRITPATLSTGGHPYNLYKVGSNQVSLVTLTVDTNLGNIDIQGGLLGFEQGTTSMGNPASNIVVEVGSTLEFFASLGTNNFTKQFILNGNGIANTILNSSGNITLNGNMTLSNACLFTVNGTVITNNCVVSGSGSLTKASGGLLILSTNETYTGDTIVKGGTFTLVGTASIAQSTNITVQAGATIDVSGRANGTLTLAGQTLAGGGTINGTLTNNADGTVTPGGGGINSTNALLSVTTNATLLGTTVMNLNNTTNDVISVGGVLTYGGTLNVTTNASGTTMLAPGESFKLFKAASLNNAFTTLNLPALPSGLSWTNGLAVDGSIGIISSGAGIFTTPPGSLTFSLNNGTNVVINGTGGQAGDAYYLLVSTNVALPLSQWTVVATNVLGANGNFTFNGTNVVTPGDQQQFYILSNTNSNHQ